MAGTLQPIASLTAADHGSINTIASIVLPVTSGLIAIVRMAMRRQKFYQFESDDIASGFAFCFGVVTSILSHFCVRAGLGRHQETLDEKQVVHYFKIFWATQFLVVLTLALAKISLLILSQRITTRQMLPQTMRLLKAGVALYTLLSLFLIALQCQLSEPWMLIPGKCYTHGNVYYPITIFNMLTDAMLAFWIFPIIWGLQMKAHTKSIVLWSFGSRSLICVVDIGRMLAIRRALQSDDQTRFQLEWAIMDQIVVHLSITHATLPRIQKFFSQLQIGGMGTRIGAGESVTGPTRKGRECSVKIPQSYSNKSTVDSTLSSNWEILYSCLPGCLNKTPSVSKQRLTQPQQQQIELSGIGNSENGETEQRIMEQGISAATSLRSMDSTEERKNGVMRVMVQTDIEVSYYTV